MKRIHLCLFIFFLLSISVARAEPPPIPSPDLNFMEEYLTRLQREYGPYLPEFTVQNLMASLRQGKADLSLPGVVKGIFRYLFKEFMANSRLLGVLVILAIICAVLQNLQSAFEQETVGKLAYYVCYMAMVGLAIQSFQLAMGVGRQAIDDMVAYMQAMLPILLTMLAAMGGLVSVGFFHPIMLISINVVVTVIRDFLLPLIFFLAILQLVGNISEKYKVSKLAALMKDVTIGVLGFTMSAFLGVLVVRGLTASVMDGIAFRTAKFATKNFIPVIGGLFADSLDAVMGSALLIKNAAGVMGLILVMLICLFPVIKIISLVLVYRLAAALVQPIEGGPLVDSLNNMGNSLTLLAIVVGAVGMLFFMGLTIIIGAGNMSVMVR